METHAGSQWLPTLCASDQQRLFFTDDSVSLLVGSSITYPRFCGLLFFRTARRTALAFRIEIEGKLPRIRDTHCLDVLRHLQSSFALKQPCRQPLSNFRHPYVSGVGSKAMHRSASTSACR